MYVSGTDLVARIRRIHQSYTGRQSDPLALKIALEIEPDIQRLVSAANVAAEICAALAEGKTISTARAKRASATVAAALASAAGLTVESRTSRSARP